MELIGPNIVRKRNQLAFCNHDEKQYYLIARQSMSICKIMKYLLQNGDTVWLMTPVFSGTYPRITISEYGLKLMFDVEFEKNYTAWDRPIDIEKRRVGLIQEI